MTFLSTIQLLHSNGINLAKSIRVSANSVRNTPFYEELRTAADKYEHSGVPLSTAFAKYTSVDAQVTHMLADRREIRLARRPARNALRNV